MEKRLNHRRIRIRKYRKRRKREKEREREKKRNRKREREREKGGRQRKKRKHRAVFIVRGVGATNANNPSDETACAVNERQPAARI